MSATAPRVGFVLEQALGHITHADNLIRLIGPDERVRAEFAPIDFAPHARWARVPGHGNWTIRAGLRARRAVRSMRRSEPVDALFVHTQVPATLMPDLLGRIPSVVSLDATPFQYDELGDHYDHATGSERVERVKWRLHRRCFSQAARLVTWSEWAKADLVARYDVPESKVTVIAPGVDVARWRSERGPTAGDTSDGPVRILFVGGNLARKGGLALVEAVRRVRAGGADVELDLVTHDELPPEQGVTVHHGLGPNSPDLIDLYRRSDVFCLPTLGDCLPMVLSEAGAVGLPLVSTSVGGIGEIVRHEQTGLLVPPDDAGALTDALGRLVADPAMRHRLGSEAQRVVSEHFHAATNAARLVELLIGVAHRER